MAKGKNATRRLRGPRKNGDKKQRARSWVMNNCAPGFFATKAASGASRPVSSPNSRG